MIEVDVFWSFAIGASCACAAGKQLSKSDSAFANIYFAYTLIVLSCVFSPSGSYLLMAYPGWESMFVLNREIVNNYPSLITVFNSTNSLLGIIGFYCVHRTVRNNKSQGIVYANIYWIVPYVAMFAILGLGYDRFLFPSTYAEYHAADQQRPSLFAFFTCNVFYTLLSMGVILIPLLYYPVFAWSQYTAKELSQIRWFVIKTLYALQILVIVGYCCFIHGYSAKPEYFKDARIEFADIYAPIVGFLAFMHSLFILALIPVFCRSGITSKSTRQKKRN